MRSAFRLAAAVLLAILLPVQSAAAACAQLCAMAALDRQAEADSTTARDTHSHGAASHHDGADPHADHCGKSEMAADKCCQAHTLMADLAVVPAAVSPPSFERSWFVARWTNFIPEEPSPPPIGSAPS